MARPLRVEFEGAIYHVMSRGNVRENIVEETDDWVRLRIVWPKPSSGSSGSCRPLC